MGNIVYDEFADSATLLSELKTRLSHLEPAEVLYPQGTSAALESTLVEWKRHRYVLSLPPSLPPSLPLSHNPSLLCHVPLHAAVSVVLGWRSFLLTCAVMTEHSQQ